MGEGRDIFSWGSLLRRRESAAGLTTNGTSGARPTGKRAPCQHRDGGVVLVSEEDYEGLLETLELLSIPGMRESLAEADTDITAGRTTSVEQIFGND